MTTAIATAQFTKWNNTWAIRVPNHLAELGATVTVRKRNGEEKQVTITYLFKEFDDNTICAFRDNSPRPAAKRSYRRPATGWSNARRYRSFAARECPCCGEEEGALYNNGRCDECGYTD